MKTPILNLICLACIVTAASVAIHAQTADSGGSGCCAYRQIAADEDASALTCCRR